MKKSHLLGVVFACVFNLCFCTSANASVVNGGFETGDYSGWTLFEGGSSPDADFGAWGIARNNGQMINPDASVFDHHDGIYITQSSPGLPIIYAPTDGHNMALQLQNGEQIHRMYQDISLESNASLLTWDMFYNNHWDSFVVGDGGIDAIANYQYLAVYLRDLSDNILDTLFITNIGDPLSIGMNSFSADISSYAGQTVGLDVFMEVDFWYFDAGFDNFQVSNQLSAPIPAALWLFGSGLLGLVGMARCKKIV